MWREHVGCAVRRGLPGKSHRIQGPAGRIERKPPMALVICDMSISLDGYVTGPNDSRENPFGDGHAAERIVSILAQSFDPTQR